VPDLPEARFIEDSRKRDLPSAMYKFHLYSGKVPELYVATIFRLGDKLCQGPITGDDFYDVRRRRGKQ
ncbi:unnamed protein product, partial [Laminaria digitata]